MAKIEELQKIKNIIKRNCSNAIQLRAIDEMYRFVINRKAFLKFIESQIQNESNNYEVVCKFVMCKTVKKGAKAAIIKKGKKYFVCDLKYVIKLNKEEKCQ